MHLSDFAIVFATFMGPIAAVQLQKFLDRHGERNKRQVEVFRALMASRTTPNSPQYVNALNAVPLEFHENQHVMSAWNDLLIHLNSDASAQPDAWAQIRVNRFIALLKAMGESLHYNFREAQLQDHAYFPKWQLALMNDQEVVRKGLTDLLTGKTSLPMNVTGFPIDQDMAKRTANLQGLLLEWLEGTRVPKMATTGEVAKSATK